MKSKKTELTFLELVYLFIWSKGPPTPKPEVWSCNAVNPILPQITKPHDSDNNEGVADLATWALGRLLVTLQEHHNEK